MGTAMSEDERCRAIDGVLDGARAGDTRSINRLYARLWPLVFGYCYHRLRQAWSAEDAAQDAIAEVLRRAGPAIRTPAALWSYSRLVARKHCDRQTRRKRVGTVTLAEVSDGSRRDPLSEFLEQEERRRVMAELWSLSPALRVVVVLYYVHEYRTGEIAAFLGTSVEVVKKRLSDGRKKLQGRLAMVEGVLRDFGALVKMGNRNMQKLLRELDDADIGRVLHVVAPELRAKIEQNVSARVLDRAGVVLRNGGEEREAVRRFWTVLDKLLERGTIDLGPYEDPPEAARPVAAMTSGPGEGTERRGCARSCTSFPSRPGSTASSRSSTTPSGVPMRS